MVRFNLKHFIKYINLIILFKKRGPTEDFPNQKENRRSVEREVYA